MTEATQTRNGVTYTNNGDGTWTVNGTATSDSYGIITEAGSLPFNFPVILSGCPSGGTSDTFWLQYYLYDGTNTARDYGNGVTLTPTGPGTKNIAIYVHRGTTMNNVIFKPMLRDARISSTDFVQRIPNIYFANWTASSSSANNTVLTQRINLSAGIYIIYCHRPSCSTTTFSMNMRVNGNDFRNYTVGTLYDNVCAVQRFTTSSYIEMVSTQSASATFTNLERGKLIAVKISNI
jgi:hypothetical protein